MSMQKQQGKHRCRKCGKVYTSLMRLQHHRAAEHAPRTSRDIYTTRDLPRRAKVIPASSSKDAV